MQRFLKWTSVQTCPNPICYIFVGFPIWVSGISDTGKRCFGIRGLECCFSLIGVGFPNLGIRSAEAPQILDVCVCGCRKQRALPQMAACLASPIVQRMVIQAGGLFFPLRT